MRAKNLRRVGWRGCADSAWGLTRWFATRRDNASAPLESAVGQWCAGNKKYEKGDGVPGGWSLFSISNLVTASSRLGCGARRTPFAAEAVPAGESDTARPLAGHERYLFFRHDFVLATLAADFEGEREWLLLEGRDRDFGVSVDIGCGKKAAAILEFCVESYFLFFIT
ncbi:hypothetical protein EMIT0P291_110178 [Pseudomonas sp. IT-P291]